MNILFIIAVVVSCAAISDGFLNQKVGSYLDCYWRVYNGEIPPDAVHGGHDPVNGQTYIGQGLVYFIGYDQIIYAEVPLTIYPGNLTTVAPIGTAVVAAPHSKILSCASQSSLKWKATSPLTFLRDVLEEKPIIGGVQAHLDETKRMDTIYIGRASVGNKIVIGKILVKYDVKNGYFYYVDGADTKQASSFDVLVYNL